MTTSEAKIIIGSLKAGADLSQKKYRLLKFTSTNLQLCGAGDKVTGVNATGMDGNVWPTGTTPKGVTGDPIELVIGGICKVKAGAAVAVGDYIKADANAAGIPAVATNVAYGQAVSAAANGEIFSMIFFGGAGLTV